MAAPVVAGSASMVRSTHTQQNVLNPCDMEFNTSHIRHLLREAQKVFLPYCSLFSFKTLYSPVWEAMESGSSKLSPQDL